MCQIFLAEPKQSGINRANPICGQSGILSNLANFQFWDQSGNTQSGESRSILISPQPRFLPIGKKEQSGTWTAYLRPPGKIGNQENMPIGPIGKAFQSGQSGKPSNLTNRESLPIGPIGKALQSGESGKQSNLAHFLALRKANIGACVQDATFYEKHRIEYEIRLNLCIHRNPESQTDSQSRIFCKPAYVSSKPDRKMHYQIEIHRKLVYAPAAIQNPK